MIVPTRIVCAALLGLGLLPRSVSASPPDPRAFADAVAAERARAPAPRLQRADLLVQDPVAEPQRSPDGRWVAYFRVAGSARSVWLLDTRDEGERQLLATTEARSLHWTRDSQSLLLESPRQLFALDLDDVARSAVVSPLGAKTGRKLLAIDPTRPAAVVVLEGPLTGPSPAAGWRLLRIDTRGRIEELHKSLQRISGFALDRRGRLAYLARVDGLDLGVYRLDALGKPERLLRCTRLQRCSLLPLTDASGDLLLLGDAAGAPSHLLRLDHDGRLHTLHVDPLGQSDIDAISVDPRDGSALIARHASTRPAVHGLTRSAQAHVARITGLLGARSLAIQAGGADGMPWLIGERDSQVQGTRWHLYDPAAQSMRRILLQRPLRLHSPRRTEWIAETALARRIPFDWRASDGMLLHGQVLLPPGRNPAGLPLIAHIHGGPWNHVRPEFDAVTQLLANRGYAVFEPDFRGSTGHGLDYLRAARGDFGNGRVQQDIVEGVRALLAQGVGDRARVGISGASFGGYSSLLGVSFQPELFQVAVAIVPPTDLGWDLRWVSRSSEALELAGHVGFDDWLRMVDLDLDDPVTMARLQQQSPLAQAETLRRPVLLVAGARDRRVPVRGVIEYAARLKMHGADLTLLIDPEAGHSGGDPLAREARFYLMERILHRVLGGADASAPDPALQDYLQRTVRIPGRSRQEVGTSGPVSAAAPPQ